jgi:hypothetical protein
VRRERPPEHRVDAALGRPGAKLTAPDGQLDAGLAQPPEELVELQDHSLRAASADHGRRDIIRE